MQTNIVNIVIMFLVLIIVSAIIYNTLGVKVQYDVENFTFCKPDECDCACDRNMYKAYCNSPYLKDGPEALCNCQWDDASRKCVGSRDPGARCAL